MDIYRWPPIGTRTVVIKAVVYFATTTLRCRWVPTVKLLLAQEISATFNNHTFVNVPLRRLRSLYAYTPSPSLEKTRRKRSRIYRPSFDLGFATLSTFNRPWVDPVCVRVLTSCRPWLRRYDQLSTVLECLENSEFNQNPSLFTCATKIGISGCT